MPDNALHDLIRSRREALGTDGHPVSYDWVAERAGVPTSTVHAIATKELKSLTEGVRTRLDAIAQALEVDPAELQQAAVEAMGYRVRVTYRELDDEQETLIGAYDDLDEEQRRQVMEYTRFLRTQRRRG